ncbi:lantibiotic dehydratase [Fodinicola acaciae]|uniref:lantibiotic dehydratase n=1 Tax=Fodinicola acaciae TaxID=2681555 RepID=UPI0013D46593|nr:lantibiotic dehydratase [Fodinicola acaciae]
MSHGAPNGHYRHTGVALARVAVWPVLDSATWWPQADDTDECVTWLRKTWADNEMAEAIQHASPSLAAAVRSLLNAHVPGDADPLGAKRIRRATEATARYVLRATGRPTPFGLFAGVATAEIGGTAQSWWGSEHRAFARVDTEWLSDVVDQLESNPAVLERVEVVVNNLVTRHGDRREIPYGPDRVSIRATTAVRRIRQLAATPIRFDDLATALIEAFPADNREIVVAALTELIHHRFLITCLRAPHTTTDPLGRLITRLVTAGAEELPKTSEMLAELQAIHAELDRHNQLPAAPNPEHTNETAADLRTTVTNRLRLLSMAGRIPLAVDLSLDTRIRLPANVAEEAARAASALLRLTRHPTGLPVWREYHAAFLDRYGLGALVPVTEVLDPTAGLGYPAGYSGSLLPTLSDARVTERDQRFLALAWQEVGAGSSEIMLTDDMIDTIAGKPIESTRVPPHVEIAVRVHANSIRAIDRGEYLLTAAPARAGGVLTSRFTSTTTGTGLERVYRDLPVGTAGALPVQLSFPPAYPHAENVCRVPAYVPDLLCLGEHRDPDLESVSLADVAVYATTDRLHLVSVSRGQVLEPQVFHALDLDKQPPPLARFLAHLTRGYRAAFTVLDFGPNADLLPYLPRVRYGRTILAPARWRLDQSEFPSATATVDCWRVALDRWRQRWHWPVTVDLRDDDRTVQLTLDEPLHTAILRNHLARAGHAVLTEPVPRAAYHWLDGHAHDIALPLASTHTPAPSPLNGVPVTAANWNTAYVPGAPGSPWFSTKLHTHPDHVNTIVTQHLPDLLAKLQTDGRDPAYWFVRYRSQNETDHLRLRLQVADSGACDRFTTALGTWVTELRDNDLAGRFVVDTYFRELGRYGPGAAMDAAEAVFAADSRVVADQLRQSPDDAVDRTVQVAVNMVHIAVGFLGTDAGLTWLAARSAAAANPPSRDAADRVARLIRNGQLLDQPESAGPAWSERRTALAAYRRQLAMSVGVDTVLESLLHMHHNRAIGINRDHEQTCRRLALRAARAYRATHTVAAAAP